jgi:hypothetical protein
MSWVGDFGDEKWASGVGDVGSAAHDESTSEVQGIPSCSVALLGEALHQGTDDDNGTSDSGAFLSTKPVGDVGSEEEDEKSSEAGHGPKDTETTSFGVIENWCPGLAVGRQCSLTCTYRSATSPLFASHLVDWSRIQALLSP